RPTTTTMSTDTTYIASTTVPAWSGKNAPARSTYTVSRAAHDVYGTRNAVSVRCRASGSVRVAASADRLHPNPTTSGSTARPSRPIARIARSATNAARAR